MKKKSVIFGALVVLLFFSTAAKIQAGTLPAGDEQQSAVQCGGSYTQFIGSYLTNISGTSLPSDINYPGRYCITEVTVTGCSGGTSYETEIYKYNDNFNVADLTSAPTYNGCSDGDNPYDRQSYNAYYYPIITTYLTATSTILNEGEGQTTSELQPNVTLNGQGVDGAPLPSGLTCSINNGVGSYTGTNAPFAVSPSSTTTYTLTCNYNGSSYPSTSSVTVTVIPPLANNVMCSASPTTVNEGQNVTWSSTVTGGVAPYSYSWTGDGFLAGATSANVTGSYSYAGSKSGEVTVTDSSSIPESQTVTLQQHNADNCSSSDTNTGFLKQGVDDGDTPNESGATLDVRNLPGAMYNDPTFAAATDFHTNPQNYCVQEALGQHYCTGQQCVTSYTATLYSGNALVASGAPGSATWSIGGAGNGPQVFTAMCTPSTITVNGNNPPTPPILVCPATGVTGQALGGFQVSAHDPQGDNVRYGIDWNNNGTIDTWLPSATTYTANGNTLYATNTWATPGTYTIGAIALDTQGEVSATSTCSVQISNASLPDLTASLVSGQQSLTGTTGTLVPVEAQISNIGNAATGAEFPDTFWVNTTQSESGPNAQYLEFSSGDPGPGNPTGGFGANYSETDGFPQVPTFGFTFTNPGTYYYRACADQDQSGNFSITESNYTNNCSAWGTITVTAAQGSVACTDNAQNPVSPGSVITFTGVPTAPATSPYTWTMNGTGVPGTGPTNTYTIPSNAQTGNTYLMTVQAQNAPGNYSCGPTINVNTQTGSCTGSAPPTITANGKSPSIIVEKGSTATIAWNATGSGGSCTITGPGVNQTASCDVPTGSATPTINTQSVYTITCSSGTASVIVNVTPSFNEF